MFIHFDLLHFLYKVRDDYKIVENKYRQSSDTTHNMKRDLEKLDDLFASITREMNERGRSMSDMTPLLNLKAAMDNIKLEIKNFNVRIGVLVCTSSEKQIFKHCSLTF
jgi:estrogen-related receptor beta like 1